METSKIVIINDTCHSSLSGIFLNRKDSEQVGMTAKSTSFKLKKARFSVFSLFAVCCLLTTLFGCGYTLHGKASLPFHAIHIGIIENRTVEPKLQDKLYQTLTDEFLKQGIAVYHRADYQLKGKIDQFELRIMSETSDVATEYEVIIKGDFTITGPSGYIKELKDVGSPFIISFSGSGQLTTLLSFKELASDRAVRDMAQEIVAALIYR
ncbi:MAG: LPS assembly lipoprotein LptE [Thermodesulfovibrionales bacterium]|jgi:hypothetical protein|nr:LPS assembly lipoprotein LptE [Thermodesulfovibrionales bacterium]